MEKINFNIGDTVVVYKIQELGYPSKEQKGIMVDNTVENINELTEETAYDNILMMSGTKMHRIHPTYITGGLYRIKLCKIVLVEKSILSLWTKTQNKATQILNMNDEELSVFLEKKGFNGRI